MKPSRQARTCSNNRGLLVLSLASGLWMYSAYAQTTWTGATGGQWGTAANWTAGVPNSTGAAAYINTALTVNVSDTGTGGTYPYTFGTLATTLTSNSVVVGDNSVTTDILMAAVASGTPIVDVANGGTIFYYASLQGAQGIQKNGAGKFTFRFNGADQTYTGNILVIAGVFGINQDGSLGNANNDLTIANGARLLAEPGSNSGIITLPSTRSFTFSGAQSQIGVSPAAVTMVINGPIGESAAGMGLVKTDAGKLTLAGAISYTGETRIAGGTLAMSGSALLPPGQNLRFNQNAACGLDLGGTSQTVRTIVMDVTTANRAFTGGGNLTVNGDANLQLNANNGVIYDFSGINTFTFNKSTRQFNVQVVNAAGVTTLMDMNLAKSGGTGGTNTITASQILIGGGDSNGNNGNTAKLHLGTINDFRTLLLQIGGFNAGGVVDFQSGLTNPSLKIRGTDGTTAATTWKIGETSSGSRRGEGAVNLTGGSLDALVTDLVIGKHLANADVADTSSLTMPAGQLTAATIVLAEKSGTGVPTLTATLTQSGGNVKVDALTMGKDANGGATPLLKPTYNLNGGTLFAKTIDGGSGAFNATSSVRNLNINGGTVRNYDASSDLTVDGVDSTAGGRLNIVLGASGGTIHADPGRSITITPFAPVSGSGGLIKQGAGTLTLQGDNNYSGTTSVSAGKLMVNGTHSGGDNYTVNSGATLGGTGVLNLASGKSISVHGELAPGASIGELSGDTSFTLNPGASFRVEFDLSGGTTPGVDNDVVSLSGSSAGVFTTGGAQLNLDLVGGSTYANRVFTIVRLTGTNKSVSYTSVFANLTAVTNQTYYKYRQYNLEAKVYFSNSDIKVEFTSIPEPTGLAMLAVGSILTGRRRRR